MSQVPPKVEVKESGSRISRPYVVVGVPEVGLVGTIACSYIVEQLGLEPRGYVDSDLAPQVMVVRDSVPAFPVQLFGKDGVVAVLSDVPLTSKFSRELARGLAAWAKSREAKMVVGLSGVPSSRREESQAEEKPSVVGVSNDPGTQKALGPFPFEQGVITGFYASLMKYCTLAEQPNVTLLGESLVQFPDPAAAAAVLEALGQIIPVKVDTKPLLKASEEVRMKTRELMKQTQAQQAQQPGGSPSAYR